MERVNRLGNVKRLRVPDMAEDAKVNLSSKIIDWDLAIRSGRIDSVISDLRDVTEVSSQSCVDLAQIARRVGAYDLSLKWLSPLFGEKSALPAIDAQIEYCMVLRRIGCVSECHLRLSEIDVLSSADALFCQLQLAMNLWDWEKTIEVADTYIKLFPQRDPYQLTTVRVNQVAAWAAMGEMSVARDTLIELLATLQLNGWNRLLANCNELMAQLLIQEKKYLQARDYLNLAMQISPQLTPRDALFIQRWEALIQCHETGSTDPLNKIYIQAKVQEHYETLRAIDYDLTTLSFCKERYNHLYFGTPYPQYRRMLQSKFGKPDLEYTLQSRSQLLLDLSTGQIENQVLLPPGGKLHLTMKALVSDFYQPVGFGELFERIFVDEPFNEESSGQRVRQLVSRLRKKMHENSLSIDIHKDNWFYKMTLPDGLGIKIQDDVADSRSGFYLSQLKAQFGSQPFSSRQAREHLSLSRSSCHRILGQAVADQAILHKGFGLRSTYQFVDPKSST